MNLGSLSLKLSAVASKMMGLSAPSKNTILASGTDIVAGDYGFFEMLWQIIVGSFGDMLTYTFDLIIKMFYAIGHWVLVIIDFIFVFVRQFIGMNTDFTSVKDLTEGDIVFQFIFSESVLKIIRNLLLFGIVLLILFSIFAIIKSEYEFMTQQTDNSKKKILVNALKSLFLMIFVPVVAIGSIIMSNAILKSLYLATSGGNDSMSIGTQIFLASTYDANAYRRYANNDMKIPITYNFDTVSSSDATTSYYTDGTVAETESALREFKSQDVWTRGFTTYLMIITNSYLNMSDVDALDKAYANQGKISPYHEVYDTGLSSRKEQYLIMADVVEYAMKKNRTLYFKTLEECYDSYQNVRQHLNGKTTPITTKTIDEEETFCVSVKYDGDLSVTEFQHTKGATDEANGAVFVVALEEQVVVNAGTDFEEILTYYSPMQNGYDDFATDYYSGIGNVIIAKGLFEDGENPTAIREDDGVVEFYRDDLNIPMLTDIFPKISYEMPEGSTENVGTKILRGAVKALTGVDISQFIPYVYFSVDLFHMFTKQSYVIVDLEGGAFKLNYNFTSKDFDKTNVFKMADFNIVIFVLASVTIALMLFKLLIGIVFRVLDLTTLAITYPAVLSTIPLDDGSRFKSWVKEFATKLLSVYAVIVAMNLVLMLAPVAERIDVFTQNDIDTAVALGQLRVGLSAKFLNELTHYLFILVAFASIEPFVALLDEAVQGKKTDPKKEGILKDGDDVVNDLKKSAVFIGQVSSGEIFITAGKEVLNTAAAFAMPGVTAIAQEASSIQDKINKLKSRAQHEKDKKDVFDNVKNAMQTKSSDGKADADSDSESPDDKKDSAEETSETNPDDALPENEAPETGTTEGESSESESSSDESSGTSAEDESTSGDTGDSSSSGGAGETGEAGSSDAGDSSDDSAGGDSDGEADSSSESGPGETSSDSDADSSDTGEASPEDSGEAPGDTSGSEGESGDGESSGSGDDAGEEDGGDADETGEASTGEIVDDDEIGGSSGGKVGRGIAKFAGGLVLNTALTTVKLAGKLALVSGKLVLGLTKTALKMSGVVVKATWKNLVNIGEQNSASEGDSSKINYAGALGGFAGAGAKAFGVGMAGVVKEGSKFVGRTSKASAQEMTKFVGNVFSSIKKPKTTASDETGATNEGGKTKKKTPPKSKNPKANKVQKDEIKVPSSVPKETELKTSAVPKETPKKSSSSKSIKTELDEAKSTKAPKKTKKSSTSTKTAGGRKSTKGKNSKVETLDGSSKTKSDRTNVVAKKRRDGRKNARERSLNKGKTNESPSETVAKNPTIETSLKSGSSDKTKSDRTNVVAKKRRDGRKNARVRSLNSGKTIENPSETVAKNPTVETNLESGSPDKTKSTKTNVVAGKRKKGRKK